MQSRQDLPTSDMRAPETLNRKKSLVRPERAREGMVRRRSTRLGRSDTIQRRALADTHRQEGSIWGSAARCLTVYAQPICLRKCCGKRDAIAQQVITFPLSVDNC